MIAESDTAVEPALESHARESWDSLVWESDSNFFFIAFFWDAIRVGGLSRTYQEVLPLFIKKWKLKLLSQGTFALYLRN